MLSNKRTYWDGFGRVIFSKSFVSNEANAVQVDTRYGSNGKVSQKSLPHFVNDTPRWIQYTYDSMGRPYTVTNPTSSGTITSTYGYNRNQTTSIDFRGFKRTQDQDPLGRVVKVRQYVDTNLFAEASYEYDIFGKLTTVTGPGSSGNRQTMISYDSLSRKTSINDPAMGGWTYTYDENGNLLTQTDANDRIITYTYDDLNRPLTKTYPGPELPTVKYDYDTAVNGKGRVARIWDDQNPNSQRYTDFAYDYAGRATQASSISMAYSIPPGSTMMPSGG